MDIWARGCKKPSARASPRPAPPHLPSHARPARPRLPAGAPSPLPERAARQALGSPPAGGRRPVSAAPLLPSCPTSFRPPAPSSYLRPSAQCSRWGFAQMPLNLPGGLTVLRPGIPPCPGSRGTPPNVPPPPVAPLRNPGVHLPPPRGRSLPVRPLPSLGHSVPTNSLPHTAPLPALPDLPVVGAPVGLALGLAAREGSLEAVAWGEGWVRRSAR